VLNVPSEVQLVTLEIDGTPYPVTQTQDGWTARAPLSAGEHTFIARGYDRPTPTDAVVLYKAHERKNVTPGQEVRLTLYRLTSDVEVVVAKPEAGEDYVAKAGGSEAALPGGRGNLQGVPTGRNIPLLVEARDSSGTLRRQGSVTFDLSESPQTVQVTLNPVAYQPPSVALTGGDSVDEGQPYTLEVQVQDPNPEASGVTLTTLLLDWGDGNQETIPLSGRQVSLQRSHTYTAAGSFTITAQARNSAGLVAQASRALQVLEVETPITITPAPDLTRVVLEVTGAPSGTTALTAEITPETPLVPQSLRPLDLKNQYRLALYWHNGAWRGALSLPSGLVYRLVLVANTPSGEVRSQEETFQATGAEMSLQKTFGGASTGGASTPLYTARPDGVYRDGVRIPLYGVNWFGLETCDRAPHGLWSGRSVADFLAQVKGWGFTALRVPVSPQVLRDEGTVANWAQVGDPAYPTSPYQGLRYFLARAQEAGLYVLLDFHTFRCDLIGGGLPGRPFDPSRGYTRDDWFQDLRRMAGLSLDFPNVFGIDLTNEPYNLTWSEWKALVQDGAAQVLAVNPRILVAVEGVGNLSNNGGYQAFWGENLAEATDDLGLGDRLLYLPHTYGPDVYQQPYFSDPSFPSNMPAIWNAHFGHLSGRGLLWGIGEFGGRYQNQDRVWQDAFVDYLLAKGVKVWFYWALNPNSGDTGGLLQDDWRTPVNDKLNLLRRLMGQ
jgi:aryl-phospho-beta-D-glucosidase BglC (GH1 family)